MYRVIPIYKGKNQIPTGILIEDQGSNTEFTLCRFCYNIKKKVKFKYSDGSITMDNRGVIKYLKKVKTSIEKKKQERTRNTNFVVNSKTKKYHMEDCKISNKLRKNYFHLTIKIYKIAHLINKLHKIYQNKKEVKKCQNL